jgi:hypothetical protein
MNPTYFEATLLIQTLIRREAAEDLEDLGFHEGGRWTGETLEAVVTKVQRALNLKLFKPEPDEDGKSGTLVYDADESSDEDGNGIFEVHTLTLMKVELEHLDAIVLKKGAK